MFAKVGSLKYLFRTNTLKHKLTVILIISSFIPLTFIGATSFYSISSIQKSKINIGINSTLKQTRQNIENTLSNLDYASRQLILNGKVGENLNLLLSTSDLYEKYRLKTEIEENLSLINFSNQDLGLMFYYMPNEKDKIAFENLEVRPDFDVKKLPLISSHNGVSYFGPHQTAYRYGNNVVLSMVREAKIPGRENIYVYMETNYKIVQRLLNNQQYGMGVFHFVIDEKGKIAFSENNKEFSTGNYFTHIFSMQSAELDEKKEFYIFKDKSELGWEIAAAIKKSDYDNEKNKWLYLLLIIVVITLIISLILSVLIWRKVYHPIEVLGNQIKLVGNNTFDSPLKFTRIKEFDDLLNEFNSMRGKIKNLLIEVEQKEKHKRHLEVEKLLYQINPHFLHNTLDTVRWMARMNGQDDIDKIVSSLNRLLHYNLGKQGEITNIKEELAILDVYITIQKAKYDFEFIVNADTTALDMPIPRFLLQPLVENSLKHGLKDMGKIEVNVSVEDNSYIVINVSDNGKGMTEEKRQKLLAGEINKEKNDGFGIGINYVKNIANYYYGTDAKFDIYSNNESGTQVILKIPTHLDINFYKN